MKEELIEEAAKAIADYQGVRYDSALRETWDGMARAALAVFEKAHVSTLSDAWDEGWKRHVLYAAEDYGRNLNPYREGQS